MTGQSGVPYPPEAYAPDGTLWWRLKTHPGKRTRYGDELKLMAWLTFNKHVGDTATMPELRAALGDEVVPNSAEHLNRRLRALRHRDGWIIFSKNDDGNLPVGVYRIERKGWHPGRGTSRGPSNAVSKNMRRRVFERDGSRCVVCGVAGGEPYPSEPNAKATLTVGHIVPGALGGSSKDINNLRTECKRCNEPVRHELRPPETLEQVLPDIQKLKNSEQQRLLSWFDHGYRTRDKLDQVYDRARQLSPDDKEELKARLRRWVGGNG
jgi:5-methylcytosine-specific restriction endonuclease McrA